MALATSLGLTDTEIDRRMAWLEFTGQDVANLASLNGLAEGYVDEVIEDLYRHFFSFDETSRFFPDAETHRRVKHLQREYFLRLTAGNYGREYVHDRLEIGATHHRIGLDVQWYLGAYCFYMRVVGRRIFAAFADDPAKAERCFLSLVKLVFLDIGLAIEIYLVTIRKQEEAIRELSTPVLQLREGLLMLPIIGFIDAARARQLTEQLLRAIRAHRAKVVVMDITGVPSLDSQSANHLVHTIYSARLMGAIVIVTGLSAEVARSLMTLGIDLGTLHAVLDLQGGIEEADRMLGYRVERGPPALPGVPPPAGAVDREGTQP
jgi:rsbT co-antagonist protein RsbR